MCKKHTKVLLLSLFVIFNCCNTSKANLESEVLQQFMPEDEALIQNTQNKKTYLEKLFQKPSYFSKVCIALKKLASKKVLIPVTVAAGAGSVVYLKPEIVLNVLESWKNNNPIIELNHNITNNEGAFDISMTQEGQQEKPLSVEEKNAIYQYAVEEPEKMNSKFQFTNNDNIFFAAYGTVVILFLTKMHTFISKSLFAL